MKGYHIVIIALLGLAFGVPSCAGKSEIQVRLQKKSAEVQQKLPAWIRAGGSPQQIKPLGAQVKALAKAGKLQEAEAVLDDLLAILRNESAPRNGATAPGIRSKFDELIVDGDQSANGIFDPSLEYGDDGVGWLAYSSVKGGPESVVKTQIAKSTDGGRTWEFVTTVNPPVVDVLEDGRKKIEGIWWNEVATLVHDPADRGREWKLYWHKYFAKTPFKGPKDRKFDWGWIAYRFAENPGGPWSQEVPLLGIGDSPQAPFQTRINVADLHPDLKDYKILTEPGSVRVGDTLYLSLQAVKPRTFRAPAFDTILLASRDHGETWTYVRTLLTTNQASAFGGDGFTGSSLAREQDRVFLLVCPEKHGSPKTAHKGTVIFEFDDIKKGLFRQDANGSPLVIARIEPDLNQGGQSDYDEQNTYGGIVMPQLDDRNFPRPFRIFNTKRKILN